MSTPSQQMTCNEQLNTQTTYQMPSTLYYVKLENKIYRKTTSCLFSLDTNTKQLIKTPINENYVFYSNKFGNRYNPSKYYLVDGKKLQYYITNETGDLFGDSTGANAILIPNGEDGRVSEYKSFCVVL